MVLKQPLRPGMALPPMSWVCVIVTPLGGEPPSNLAVSTAGSFSQKGRKPGGLVSQVSRLMEPNIGGGAGTRICACKQAASTKSAPAARGQIDNW